MQELAEKLGSFLDANTTDDHVVITLMGNKATGENLFVARSDDDKQTLNHMMNTLGQMVRAIGNPEISLAVATTIAAYGCPVEVSPESFAEAIKENLPTVITKLA